MYNQAKHFTLESCAYLDAEGRLLRELEPGLAKPELVKRAYRAMVKGRIFDKKAIALQRTGKMGTYPSILGQEAIGAAIGLAMHADDVFAPYYRDLITQHLRGVSLSEVLLYWGGDERGSAYKHCRHDFPNCVPIATQLCHAAGAAIQLKIRGIHRAAVATCGEGATSKGDFLETLNLAGAWQLPLVMVVNNNQWAISTPRSAQTAAETIAQKAIGAGIKGVQVDGNDFFAVYGAVTQALEKAYAGKGASLIEAVTYRLGDHTTADDADRYRKQTDLEHAWAKEPVKRLRAYMAEHLGWNDENETALVAELEKEIDQAVVEYQNMPAAPVTDMFDYLFEEMPQTLKEQRAQIVIEQLVAGGAS